MKALRLLASTLVVAFSMDQTAVAQQSPPADLTDVVSPPENVVASLRYAWAVAMTPDGSWAAVSYGHWGSSEPGQVCVWDLATGKTTWFASEPRGARAVAVSPDGTLVASGNFGGDLTLREAATGKVRQQLREPAGSIERIAFSNDGKRVATASNGRAVRIWDLESGKPTQSFDGHTEVAYWVAFSPDEKLLVSASKDGSARIWNAADGVEKHNLKHPGEVSAAVFLADGKHVATVCHDGQTRLWSVTSGELKLSLMPSEARGTAVALGLSQDGKLLATSSYQDIHVWNTDDWSQVATLTGHQSLVFGVAWANGGKRLVSAAWDNAVRVWDVAGQKESQALLLPTDARDAAGPVRTLSVSPNGRQFAIAGDDPAVLLRDRSTGAILRRFTGPEERIAAVAFSPDGLSIAAVSGDRRAHVWDAKTGELRGKLGGHEGGALSIAWSADSRWLASGGNDHILRLWEAKSLKEVAGFEGHSSAIAAVAFSPDGLQLASADQAGTIRVWDVAGRREVASLREHTGPLRAIAFSPDGKTIASAGDDQSVKLWDAGTYKLRASVAGHRAPILSLAFSPQGKTLASGGAGGGLHLIDPVSGVLRKTYSGHTGAVSSVAFLRDGSGLLTAGEDRTVRLWKAAPPPVEPLWTVSAHATEAFSVRFSPDGKLLATGGKDGLIALRDPATGDIVRTLEGHKGIVYEIAFPPDGAVLASSSSDGTVRLWSVERGVELAKFNAWKEKFAGARTLDFNATGDMLAVGSGDGSLKLWNVNSRKVERALIGQALPVTGVRFSPDGSLLATCTGDWQNWRVAGELRLWDAKTGDELASLEGHAVEIKRLAFDRSGTRLATAGGQVIVYNSKTREISARIRTDASATALCYLQGGQLVVGDVRGGVGIWDESGTALVKFAGHEKNVPAVAVSPDDRFLATVALDGTVKLWAIPKLPQN